MTRITIICATLAIIALTPPQTVPVPIADHHQHLFGPAIVARGQSGQTIDAADLIALLDAAGIRKAVVLSIAYQFSNPNRPPVDDEYARVRAENDWTSAQVARFPGRLRAFCSVNPLQTTPSRRSRGARRIHSYGSASRCILATQTWSY
jgi:hypothetical protein